MVANYVTLIVISSGKQQLNQVGLICGNNYGAPLKSGGATIHSNLDEKVTSY